MSSISQRKTEHLDLCLNRDVESHRGTLLDDVELIHEALPERSLDEVDASIELFGRRLHSPLLISGMTGGSGRARDVNLGLATAAEKCGIGMGLGSQRAMWVDPELASTYRVRSVAPSILLLANLGAVQAREVGLSAVAELVDAVGADALCVHLNVAQELTQDEGDRDFRGCLATIERLVSDSGLPVVVKETGCGFSRSTLARLQQAGVAWVDVAGAGGTTWTGVEAPRGSAGQRQLGVDLREWGVPTAAAISFANELGLGTIASGGVRTPLDVVRALVLGARAVGMALPFLRAHEEGGVENVLRFASQLDESIRAIFVLTGASSVESLRDLPFVVGPRLRTWIEAPSRKGVSIPPSRRAQLDDGPYHRVSGLDSRAVMAQSRNENFPVASRILPATIREDLFAIYGFARLVDQIGDEAAGDRQALLDQVHDDLTAAYSKSARHPLLETLSRTIHRRELPPGPFLRLIEANRIDQRLNRIETWEELLTYCSLSANPVGELVLRVFGQCSEENVAYSDSICSALQVVEHCQDVAEDLARGRIYLPAEDLDAFNCEVDRLGAAPAPESLRRVIRTQVERSRCLLANGRPLVGALRGWARPTVAAYVAGGLSVCDALEAARFDPNVAAVRPARRRMLRHTLGLLIRPGRAP